LLLTILGVLVLNNFIAEYSSLTTDPMPPLIQDWQDNVNGRPVIEGYPVYEPTLRIYRMRANTNNFLLPNKDNIVDFVTRVKSIHWIDGHRFPTSREVVKALADLQGKSKAEFFLHGTPRQLEDKKRKWITEEFNSFKFLMELYEVKSHVKMYFQGQPKSIQIHFKILHEFKNNPQPIDWHLCLTGHHLSSVWHYEENYQRYKRHFVDQWKCVAKGQHLSYISVESNKPLY